MKYQFPTSPVFLGRLRLHKMDYIWTCSLVRSRDDFIVQQLAMQKKKKNQDSREPLNPLLH